ncbi:papain family cysteine protease domain-containing protein [Ditylenchus destructor]|nr:papain family cysteine protease domain-containing protein [Ditylenchus destructor]
MNYQVSPIALTLRGQELVDYVNRNQDLWTAKRNPKFQAMSENMIRRMMGVKYANNMEMDRKEYANTTHLNIELPKNFDAREQWPNCRSVKSIRDQSNCGSCWAFGAVEAMSDRICIASGGKIQVSLSAADLISCCEFPCGFGCWGGMPLFAWKYWVSDGIVTGSNYTVKQGCRPYPFPPCNTHNYTNKTHYPECPQDNYHTPNCEKKCQGNYSKTYNADKFYGRTAYNVANNTRAIQTELYTNGPLEVVFLVYEDFTHYTSGIYFHTGGEYYGAHAVKLIGWGEENGVPYWTLANSK